MPDSYRIWLKKSTDNLKETASRALDAAHKVSQEISKNFPKKPETLSAGER